MIGVRTVTAMGQPCLIRIRAVELGPLRRLFVSVVSSPVSEPCTEMIGRRTSRWLSTRRDFGYQRRASSIAMSSCSRRVPS
jgi:hypothetical protein